MLERSNSQVITFSQTLALIVIARIVPKLNATEVFIYVGELIIKAMQPLVIADAGATHKQSSSGSKITCDLALCKIKGRVSRNAH